MKINQKRYVAASNFINCVNGFSKYEKLIKIGQGTFGKVYKAKDRNDSTKFVAMKKIMMEKETEGFPITALREIKILQALDHENVVNLIEICQKSGREKNNYLFKNYLVMEFCEHDLAGLLANKNVKFNLGEAKKVIQQILNGLYHIHSNKILHRDMKPSNVLITKNGTLKLADFGLSRAISMGDSSRQKCYTNRVVTLWYRSPELLLGDRNYGPSVDLWSVGCIMAEIFTRVAILQSQTEQEQLIVISKFCGSITPKVWRSVVKLELFNKIQLLPGRPRVVTEKLMPYVKSSKGCDLIEKLLTLDPNERISSDVALNHSFFWSDPMPCNLDVMLKQHDRSMFQYTEAAQQPHH